MTTTAAIDRVLSRRPDVRDALERAHAEARAATEPRLLELCRLRIAQLLGCDAGRAPDVDEATAADLPSWPTSPRFSDRDRACLAFTEHFVIDVARMPDDVANAVGAELGAQGLVDLAHALLIVEQRHRLALAWERLGL